MKSYVGFLFLLLTNLSFLEAKYGDNDFFTSLEAMKWLWKEDVQFVEKLEKAVTSLNEILPDMQR